MSSKIYFADSKNLSRYLVRGISEAYRFIRPGHAEKLLRRLLLTPQKRKPTPVPADITTDTINTEYGELTCYTLGSGPLILFVHGWSGAGSQFFGLMQTLAASGYRTLAFDHYKHGLSGGRENNYPLFVKAIEYVMSEFTDNTTVFCAVSHSMGSSATLDIFKTKPVPHFLIAPLFNFYGELESRITGAGISKGFFEQLIGSIETDYDMIVKGRSPLEHIREIDSPIHIIHSRDDKFALFDYSAQAARQQDQINLQIHSDIGHMRIVSSSETEQALVGFVKALSSTS